MKNLVNTFKKIIKDESGQGATEYILLLVVVVAIAMIFKDQIMGIVKTKIEQVGGNIGGFTAQ
jgi:Flp pilus assembly pilin Flp